MKIAGRLRTLKYSAGRKRHYANVAGSPGQLPTARQSVRARMHTVERKVCTWLSQMISILSMWWKYAWRTNRKIDLQFQSWIWKLEFFPLVRKVSHSRVLTATLWFWALGFGNVWSVIVIASVWVWIIKLTVDIVWSISSTFTYLES